VRQDWQAVLFWQVMQLGMTAKHYWHSPVLFKKYLDAQALQ
jgi:hypothetical protein